jgi:hypothetical protein
MQRVIEKYQGPPLAAGTKLNGCWTSIVADPVLGLSTDPNKTTCVCQPILSSVPGTPSSTPTSWTLVGGSDYKKSTPWGQGTNIYGCG